MQLPCVFMLDEMCDFEKENPQNLKKTCFAINNVTYFYTGKAKHGG